MKIALLVAPVEHGYSFLNQANGLAKGFVALKIDHRIFRADQKDIDALLENFNPTLVISVGDWHDFSLLVERPQSLGYTTIPWLVADGEGAQFIAHYNRLSCIITPSAHAKKVFISQGIKPDILTVVHEAVDPELWQSLPASRLKQFLRLVSPSQSCFDLPIGYDLVKARENKVPILFTTGGDATSKGAQEVMRALAQLDPAIAWIYLIKTWPSIHSFRAAMEELKLARELGITSRVRYMTGEFSQDFMRGLMSACDIYVAPSHQEGFGLPLVEAQMCGKPVISIAAHATQETVLPGETGFLVQPHQTSAGIRADIADLAKHLRILLTDGPLRQKIGSQAQRQATQNFAPAVIAKKMVATITPYC